MDERLRDEREVKRMLRKADTLAHWAMIGIIVPLVGWILGAIATSKIRAVREDYLNDSKTLADKYGERASHIRRIARTGVILSIVVSVLLSFYLYSSISRQIQAQNTKTCMANARSSYDPTVAGAAQTLIGELQACQP
jgi:hypothetical protein